MVAVIGYGPHSGIRECRRQCGSDNVWCDMRENVGSSSSLSPPLARDGHRLAQDLRRTALRDGRRLFGRSGRFRNRTVLRVLVREERAVL